MPRTHQGRKYVSGLLTFGVILLLLLLALLVGALLSYSYVKRAQENFNNPKEISIPAEKRVYIDIPSGSGTDAISKILEGHGLIKYPQLFKVLSKINGFDGSYKSGTHIVSGDLSYDELMIVLKSDPEILRLTFPEGVNSRQFYGILANSALTHGGEVEAYVESLTGGGSDDSGTGSEGGGEAELLYDYDFLRESSADTVRGGAARADRLEGYLFPDTYDFDLNATPKAILDTVLENFERKFTDELYDRAAEMDMSVDEVITLASIIEREAKNEDDRFLVSGVFHNRLGSQDASMRRLQSCATIQYIFYQRNGIMLRRISENDTRVADPYNTYTHDGLPPGPICNPGISAINAALYPEQTEYLFFVARGDGTHMFTENYEDHQAAILEYGLNLMP